MRILIVNPPYNIPIIREGRCQSPQNMRKYSVPQLTLAYLAAVLGKAQHVLRVYDCIASDIGSEELFEFMDEYKPEVALINTTTPSINADLLFAKNFKSRNPECFTALFGTHVTALHESIIEDNQYIDCIIRGEPEWSSVELCEILHEKRNIENGIDGCTVRVNNNIIVGRDREYNSNLDMLGYPSWEHFDIKKYMHPIFNKPYLMVNTSRGCSHSCIFCVGHIFYGKKVRFRSITSIIDELENHVIGKFGINHVWMYADDFTKSPEFVKNLCREIIKRKIRITWWTNTRVDALDEEMFQLMKTAGCYMLSIGGESANAKILKTIKKGTKPEQILYTVKLLRKVGINSLVYFLIGLPGETRQTIQETINFAKRLNPDFVEFYPATPYPGTEFFDIALAEGLIVNTKWDDYMCGGNQFVVAIPGVKKEGLDDILRKAYNEFYFRLSYAGVLLKRTVRPVEFFRLLNFGIGYFKRFMLEKGKR